MGIRIHLYALPGLPLHVEDLMPQPLLARCAGSLAVQGHSVLIFDEGSVERLESAGLGDVPDLLEHAIEHAGHRNAGWSSKFSTRERHLKSALESFRVRRIAHILEGLAVPPAQGLAVVQIQRRKDVMEARHLARALKERQSGLSLVAAGEFVNHHSRALLHGSPEFDAACHGPTESILAGLARCGPDRSSWLSIPGLVFRDGGQLREGKGIPVPIDPWFAPTDYHPACYPGLLDSGKIKLFTLPHSTGLSHSGHYRGGYHPRGLLVREARQMRSDMEQLHRLYGAETFHITGSHTPMESIQGFAAECLSLPFSVSYSRDAHVHELGGEALQALASSGCRALGFSLLTGSQWSLSDFYGENWSISQVEACLRRVRAQGVYVHAELMYPCPADDYHTFAETFRLLRRNRPDGVHLALPVPSPGSAWYQHAEEFDFSIGLKRFGEWVANPQFAAGPRDEAPALPFHIKGMRGGAVALRYEEALAELAELRIDQVSGAPAALMARVAGFEGREADFTQVLERSTMCLDLGYLRDIIDRFNMRATASINTLDLYPPVSIKKAVGN